MRRRKALVTAQTHTVEIPTLTMHPSVPEMAFELALFRMMHTHETTRNILNDYLRELGA